MLEIPIRPFRVAADERVAMSRKPVACLVHVYYPELWPELSRYISNLRSVPFDLLVNVVDQPSASSLQSVIERDFPNATIAISPNRGRDIGGHFVLMRSIDFSRYEIMCLIHSKKSPHIRFGGGRRWRRGLLNAILGSEHKVSANIRTMIDDPTIGAIAAKRYCDRRLLANAKTFHELLDRLEIPGSHRECEFVRGTMMLIRARVMRRLYEALKDIEFEDEDKLAPVEQLDGQVPHAIERVIGNVIRAEGLKIMWRP